MKKVILAISLSVIMLLFCGCSVDLGKTIATTMQVSNTPKTAAAATTAPAAAPSAYVTHMPIPAGNFTIPIEPKVFVRSEELEPVKHIFKRYLTGNEILIFAVSALLSNEPYLLGFIYEDNNDNDEFKLLFRRVVGFKLSGDIFEEAFISDNYKSDPNNVPENLMQFQDEPFYDTQAFEIGEMLVVKTNESLNPDCGFHNIFLLNEKGLLDNHINITLTEPCELFEYQGKLLLNESYTWYEFTVKDEKIALNEIMNFEPYRPEINENDFVITLKDFTPATYNQDKQEYEDDNYIKVNIDGIETLQNENFNEEMEDAGWGAYPVYLSKEKYKIDMGIRVILLYPPEMGIDCSIRGEMDDGGSEHSLLPGAVILRPRQPGEYIVQIENDSVYQIYITAE